LLEESCIRSRDKVLRSANHNAFDKSFRRSLIRRRKTATNRGSLELAEAFREFWKRYRRKPTYRRSRCRSRCRSRSRSRRRGRGWSRGRRRSRVRFMVLRAYLTGLAKASLKVNGS